MMIHPDQQNVRTLCELADFIDSGHQSFVEQVRVLPPRKMIEASFFAGSALALKLIEHFREQDYSRAEVEFLTGLLNEEINNYMLKNGLKLEWEPHVPTSWQQ